MDLLRPLAALVLLSLVCLPFGAEPVHAQEFEQRVTPFPVRDTTGTTFDFPFLGGLNTPRPQLVDIDADRDLDLFLQERRDRVIYFENVGSPSSPQYEWRTDHFQELEVGAWFRFGDLDDDGDLDLLAEEPISNVRYYRNDGTPESPDLTRAEGPLLRADGSPISASRQNVPALTALDCTGPPDLLGGGLDGRLRVFEHTGTRDEGIPVFRHVSDEYQNVCVGPASVCGTAQSLGESGSAGRHGANALATGDLGDDGDPDLLWGDFFNESLYLIENTGSCEAPSLERVADTFPSSSPVQTSGYNVPQLADLDGDADLDLLVGVLGGSGTGSSAVENLLYLENQGSPGQPEYTLQTRQFLSSIDVGGVSAPVLVDLDHDGDRDLVVGNDREPGTPTARLHLFENVGSDESPAFEQRPDPLLPEAEDGFNFVPAFADLTGDGAPDLFLGTFSGTVRYYQNVGAPSAPEYERRPAGDVHLPRGNYAAPALVDIDADGDQDLFVGSASAEGTIAFFRNEGTPQDPDFALETESYGEIRVGESRTHPAFADPEGDGVSDLYLGTRAGITIYENAGTPQAASFPSPSDSLALPLRRLAAPAFGDVNGDDRVDLVVGGEGGGVKYFEGQEGLTDPELSPGEGVRASPNPFANQTTLSFALDESASISLIVYDTVGRRVSVLLDRPLGEGSHTIPFRAKGRASGLYFYQLRVDGRVRDDGKLLLVH